MTNAVTITPSLNTIQIGHSLSLTQAAVLQLKRQLEKHQHQGAARLSTQDTKDGCAGMRYVFEWTPEPHPGDLLLTVDNEITLYVDPNSLPFLQGCLIDYVKQGLNSAFKFTNPNAVGTCGCGESFTVGK